MILHSKPTITTADIEAISLQAASLQLANGAVSARFESALASLIGAPVTATTSGTAALVLALGTLGNIKGKEIVLPSYVCRNVLEAVVSVDATPVICDIGEGWVSTVESVSRHLTSRTAAIVAVNIFGMKCDLSALAGDHAILEDHCQSFGLADAIYGRAAFFSFHATKCLTTGEGGAVATNYKFAAPFNKISDLQAALGISQIERYSEMLTRRRAIAQTYLDELPHDLTYDIRRYSDGGVFFRFPITTSRPFDHIQGAFAEFGIAARRGVDDLLHRRFGLPDNNYIKSVKRFNETVSIPLYPSLTDDEVDRIITATKLIFK